MLKIERCLIFIVFLYIPIWLSAGSLGGIISYKKVSTYPSQNTNKYLITYKSFGTCVTEPNWIDPIFISYFSENNLAESDHNKFPLSLLSFENKEVHSEECIQASSFCYHEKIYQGEIILPIINNTYILTLQYCCYPELTNISGDLNTVTISTEITPEAQIIENSSPLISNILDQFHCYPEENSVFIDLQDDNQDSLTIVFSGVLKGYVVGVSPEWCFSNLFPSCPPPFGIYENYISGYNYNQPLGASTSLNNEYILNFENVPIGNHLVGFTVYEYRNSLLIGKYNIATVLTINPCPKKLKAQFTSSPEMTSNTLVLCNSEPAEFQNLSMDSMHIDRYLWAFNNEEEDIETEEKSPIIYFSKTGKYQSQLLIIDDKGCEDSLNFLVEISDSLSANFSTSSYIYSNLDNQVLCLNTSTGHKSSEWIINDEIISEDENLEYQIDILGKSNIQLKITNDLECKDSIQKSVVLEVEIRYFLPTAFTPNGDGINDVYLGTGSLEYIDRFSLTIWNRFGELVFITDKPNLGWNGYDKQGSLSKLGVYMALAKITDITGKTHIINTEFQLLK